MNPTASFVPVTDGNWESRCIAHSDKDAVFIQEFYPQKNIFGKSQKFLPRKTRKTERKDKPTEKQINAIENFGLHILPSSRAAATRILSYLFEGNGTHGRDLSSRVAIAKDFEKKWLGKRVHHYDNKEGMVTGYGARTTNEVIVLRKAIKREFGSVGVTCPFEVCVQWDNGIHSYSCISLLKIIEK